MKMSQCRMNDHSTWQPAIKISDDIGKHMGDNKEFYNACHELGLNLHRIMLTK